MLIFNYIPFVSTNEIQYIYMLYKIIEINHFKYNCHKIVLNIK